MRIFAQSKVPSEFKGHPIPQNLVNILTNLDATYSLSFGEVEWLLEFCDEIMGFTTGHDTSVWQWEKLKTKFDNIFRWARETGNGVFGHSVAETIKISQKYYADRTINATFANKPWVLSWLNDKTDEVKISIMNLERESGGLSEDEFNWIVSKVRAVSLVQDYYQQSILKILKWSRETNTALSTINDLGTAQAFESEWAQYSSKLQASKRLSKRGVRSLALSGKWRAIWIDPSSRAKPEMPDDDRTQYEWEVVHDITGLDVSNTDKVIAICDPQGVPRAAIGLGDTVGHGMGTEVHSVTEYAKVKVKELVSKLNRRGEKLWWAGEPTQVEDIRDLETRNFDEYGFIPLLAVKWDHTLTVVGYTPESYRVALDWTFQDACRGSDYFSSLGNRGIAVWSDYAEQRGELHFLEEARQSFEEWANDQWDDAAYEIARSNDLPDRPDEDDEQFNVGGRFNQAVYNRALEEYYAALEPYETRFEPNQFAQTAYERIQERRNKEGNRAYYDLVEAERARKLEEQRRRQEAARQAEFDQLVASALSKPESDRTEAEKNALRIKETRRRQEAEAIAKQKAEDEAKVMQEVERSLRDTSSELAESFVPHMDDDIFAFNIDWRKSG